MRKGALNGISQNHEQFDLRVVFPDPFRRWLVVDVTRRAITGDGRASQRRIMFVQLLVISPGNEQRVIIEKMYFLLVAHGDIRVPA